MVKQTAQTLQAFGTELAETELPNDVSTTTALLAVHTEKKDKMKVNTQLPKPVSTWLAKDLLASTRRRNSWYF